jgi:iron complex outermembrane receptor protein
VKKLGATPITRSGFFLKKQTQAIQIIIPLRILFIVTLLLVMLEGRCLPGGNEKNTTMELDEIVVSDEKLPEEENVQEATAFVTVIDAKEYTSRVSSVPELLSETVGVNVREYGGLGSFSTISIRGSSSEQVAIFLDGILLNQARQGVVNLSEIPLDNVDKIEVYRGTSPARFGTAGIGGVVNIITKTPKEKPQNELTFSYGSFNTYKANAYRSERLKNFDYLIFYTMNKSEGNFKYTDDNGTPMNPHDDCETRRRNNEIDSNDLLMKLGYEQNAWRVTLSSDFFSNDQGVPGISSFQSRSASLETLRNLSTMKVSHPGFLHPSLNLESQLFFTYEWDKFQDKKGEIGVGYQDNRDVTVSYGGNVLLSHSAVLYHANNIVNLFAEIKRETYDSENKLAPVEKGDTQKRTTLSISIEEQLYLLKDRLVLSPALLYNHYQNDFRGKLPFSSEWVTPGENKNKGYLNRKMGMEIVITDFLSFKGNVGKYYRPPNFTELFGDRGSIVGNPALKAEEGTNWDIGFKMHKKTYWLLKSIFFEYAFYRNRIDNLILFIQNSQRTSVASNISKAEMMGHEISWGTTVADHVNLSGNLTVQHTEDESEISYWKGNQLPGRPQFELFNRFEYFNYLGKVFYEFNYLSNNFLDRVNFKKIAARKINNLGVSFYPVKNLTLTFEIKNLNDAAIEDVIGYPLPGRSFFTTIDFKF